MGYVTFHQVIDLHMDSDPPLNSESFFELSPRLVAFKIQKKKKEKKENENSQRARQLDNNFDFIDGESIT